MPFNWTRGEMDELCPNHVARRSVLIRPIFSHPCFDFRFNLPHRLVHGHFERIQNPFILCELVSNRNRFRTMEIKIISNRPIGFCSVASTVHQSPEVYCHTGIQSQLESPHLTVPISLPPSHSNHR